jgi:isocitrate/isopropylmalate dehydrogenase
VEKTIALIRGDGISPEIVGAALDVLNAVEKKYGHTFHYVEAPVGGDAIDRFGVPLPEESLKACKESILVEGYVLSHVIVLVAIRTACKSCNEHANKKKHTDNSLFHRHKSFIFTIFSNKI